MTIKGLPTTYNKDLQESVEPLLDHIKTVGKHNPNLTDIQASQFSALYNIKRTKI